MFHRANSSERFERKGRYTSIIVEMHMQGVYESRDILIALLQGYIDYQRKVLNSVVSLRGSVFRHTELIKKLKEHLLRLDEASYAAPFVRWLNRHYFNLNPNDDIFYLLNAFFSIYEKNLVMVNSVVDERISIENGWSKRLSRCDETFLAFLDVIFFPKIPFNQISYLTNFIRQRSDTLTCNKVGEALKNCLQKKDLVLSQALISNTHSKLFLLFPTLSSDDINQFIEFVFNDFANHLPHMNDSTLNHFMSYLNSIASYLPQLSESNRDSLFSLLVSLCEQNHVFYAATCFIQARACFSEQQLVQMQDVLFSRFDNVAVDEKINICGALVMLDACTRPQIKEQVHAFLLSFITKEDVSHSFSLVLAARHYFICKEFDSRSIRNKILTALYRHILQSMNIYVKAELAFLLLKENERVVLSIEQVENGFPIIQDKSEDIIAGIIRDLRLMVSTGVGVDYACKLLSLFSEHIPFEKKEKWVSKEINKLTLCFDERAFYVLIALRDFITERHFADLAKIAMKFLAGPSNYYDNAIFIHFVIFLKEVLPDSHLMDIAQGLYVELCTRTQIADSFFSFLLREYKDYFLNDQYYDIYQRLCNVVLGFTCSTIADGIAWYTSVADVMATLQEFTPSLSLNQIIRMMNVTVYQMALLNSYADFIFSDLYHHYQNQLANDRLLRVRADSGRTLPLEITENIINMSNKIS